MRDGDVDYSRYTLTELEEALAGIDKRQFPKNYANLLKAYEALDSVPPAAPKVDRPVAVAEVEDEWPQPRYDESGRYIPNSIPAKERVNHIIFSLLIFAYGGYGIWVNDLYVPGRRSRGVHLHDGPAWLMFGAIVCACVVMLSIVLDHYDRRNNERHYRAISGAVGTLGWVLFGVSLLWGILK